FVSLLGEEAAPPGKMSLTSTVPAAVPSLFHSSVPCVPSLAVKNSVPLTLVKLLGKEGPPGVMSLTTTVTVAVPTDVLNAGPQLVHGCGPSPEQSPAKNSVPLTFVSESQARFVSNTVPASVPSLFHSPPTAVKNSVPLTFVRSLGLEL